MDTTQAKNGIRKAKQKIEGVADAAEHGIDTAEHALTERVDRARDMVEELRDRAEMAFHERPYLLPVATGALGLGVGVLIGSKLSRLIFFAAAGALLSEQVRGQVARISKDVLQNLGSKLEQGEAEDEGDIEQIESPMPTGYSGV
jgi:ElaB/YqjD/DUF883 family membrane-anchored ribosome-binding protein